MRLVGSFFACVGLCASLGLGTGCERRDDQGYDRFDDESDPDDTLPDPASCPGECLPKPQIPFNSDIHLVWLGPSKVMPQCPEIAPIPGFEGTVISMSPMPDSRGGTGDLVVRECLLSTAPEDCGAGTTCAPIAPEDFQLCLSREAEGPCPENTYSRRVLAHEGDTSITGAEVILCCAPTSLPL